MPKLKRYWRSLQKKEKQADEEVREKARRDSDFITDLIGIFLQILSSIPKEGIPFLILRRRKASSFPHGSFK